MVPVSTSPQRTAIENLGSVSDLIRELGARFDSSGHQLALVGGPVRDALLGRITDSSDLDFTTDAHPQQIISCLSGWADNIWDTGIKFGTISAQKNDRSLEITTYRTESYREESRKPEVTFGLSLEEDLSRRDFTINSMALTLPDLEFVDLFNGVEDLERQLIRTPLTAQESFNDDPLRMMRAARFAGQLNFVIAPDVLEAMREQASRLEIVSAERIRDNKSS